MRRSRAVRDGWIVVHSDVARRYRTKRRQSPQPHILSGRAGPDPSAAADRKAASLSASGFAPRSEAGSGQASRMRALVLRTRIDAPTAPKPTSIIAHVAGSGTALAGGERDSDTE